MTTISNHITVALIDSGAGGLSIAHAICERGWNVDIVYLADHAYFPYGLMEEGTLIKRCIALVDYILNRHTIDVFVIACNTASTVVLDNLRHHFNIPFIGVVPAIKPAAAITKTGAIGVLATPATVERKYLSHLIRDFAEDKTVTTHGSNTLVRLSEDFVRGEKFSPAILEEELNTLIGKNVEIDTIVLACTHFPLIRDEIQLTLDSMTITRHIVDSSSAIANRFEDLFTGELERSRRKPNLVFFNTQNNDLSRYGSFLINKLRNSTAKNNNSDKTTKLSTERVLPACTFKHANL